MANDADDQSPSYARTEFSTPDEILAAPHLSPEEKIGLLRQWEQDLRQLMTATREGMEPAEPNQTPETLRTIRAMLRSLGGHEEG